MIQMLIDAYYHMPGSISNGIANSDENKTVLNPELEWGKQILGIVNM